MDKSLLIKDANQVVTCSSFTKKAGKDMSKIAVMDNASIYIENGIIKLFGETKDILKIIDENNCDIIDAKNKIVLPGYVDSHTHFVFGGDRADEFKMRLEGADYMEIMKAGGGINKSVIGTLSSTEDELYELGFERLNKMLENGVTTVEGKSGYGLDTEAEIKQLNVMKRLNQDHPIDIIPTFMGAHSVPKYYKGREKEYISLILKKMLPAVTESNLAEFCDVFCEKGVFSIEESRSILTEAKKLGLKLKIHADEIVDLGGAELAGELGCISADHLLCASNLGLDKMKNNNVIATILPCTAFSLGEDYARARYMIDNDMAVALATDYNPGSCHTLSIPLLIALATIQMKLTIEEVITALTINGAAAVDKTSKIGSIDIGKKADIVIHNVKSYNHIPYNIGMNTVDTVIKNGDVVFERSN